MSPAGVDGEAAPKVQSAPRRLGLLTIDQAVAGASNVLIAVLAARVLSVESFGLFWIAFLAYGVAQGSIRALIGEPLLLYPNEAESRSGDAIGVGCILGLGLGAVMFLSGLAANIWDDRLGNALIAVAFCVPFLVLQDLGRYLGFATRQPGRALTLDVVWLLLVFVAVVGLTLVDAVGLWEFMAAWGVSGGIAGLLVFWQYRTHRIQLSLRWLRETWTYSWRYLMAYTAAQGSALGTGVVFALIAGTKALAGVQGALLFQRPFVTIQIAAMASSVVDISHSSGERHVVRRMALGITYLTTAMALLNGFAMLVLPDQLGRQFLGATWEEAKPLLLPAAVQMVAMGAMSGARTGLLGVRAVRLATTVDVGKTALIVVLTIVGAFIGGAEAAMWAMVIGHVVGTISWWSAFWWRTRGQDVADTATQTAVGDEIASL